VNNGGTLVVLPDSPVCSHVFVANCRNNYGMKDCMEYGFWGRLVAGMNIGAVAHPLLKRYVVWWRIFLFRMILCYCYW